MIIFILSAGLLVLIVLLLFPNIFNREITVKKIVKDDPEITMIKNQSNETSIDSIKEDLEKTELDNIDSEFDLIEEEINASI